MGLTQDNVYRALSTQYEKINECARRIFDEIRIKFFAKNYELRSLDGKVCLLFRVIAETSEVGKQIEREMIAQRVLVFLQTTLADDEHPLEFYYTWDWKLFRIEYTFYAYMDTHEHPIECPIECPIGESGKKDDTSIFKHLSPSALEEVILSKQDEDTKANIEAAASICSTIDSVFKSRHYVAEDGSIRFDIQHYMKNDLENVSIIARLVQQQLKRLLPEPTWVVEYYSWVRRDILDITFVIKHNYVITEGK